MIYALVIPVPGHPDMRRVVATARSPAGLRQAKRANAGWEVRLVEADDLSRALAATPLLPVDFFHPTQETTR